MERPLKRVRQACEPCRYILHNRKKSKCPGEKPVCSYCARLGQLCSYTHDDEPVRRSSVTGVNTDEVASGSGNSTISRHNRSTADAASRLDVVENQLAEVLSVLRQQQQQPIGGISPVSASRSNLITDPIELGAWDLDHQLLEEAIGLYDTYCNCQPLPLLNVADLGERLRPHDRELCLSIAALSIRFHTGLSDEEKTNKIRSYASSAGSLVMQRITSGTIELRTLQSLCLLSLVEFYDGNTHRSSIYLSLAVDLSQNAGLYLACTNQPGHRIHEEQMRCFWSTVLLVRLHENLLGAFSFLVDSSSLSVYPASTPRPPLADRVASSWADNTRTALEPKDLGIMTYVIQLSEVWQRVAQYARRRRQPEAHPPWSTESEYAKILARQMDREALMPYSRHRYKPANFAERTEEELKRHRTYWGPWLLNQMMYHGIICLLNHPLLLSLRLRNFRIAEISEIWLQHTDDLVTSHTKWILHLIELVDAKCFEVTDPFLAHIAAIVATIYLQQSFADNEEARREKGYGYAKCLAFVRQIGNRWHYISILATKLEKLEGIVSKSYQNSASSETHDKVYIDLTLFWEIFESSLISEHPDPQGIKLGSSLEPQYHAIGNAEEVDAHPLPEPSRLQAVSTPTSTNMRSRRASASQTTTNAHVNASNATGDDFAVLAQSYFAQGQDFVGGLDDWWTFNQE